MPIAPIITQSRTIAKRYIAATHGNIAPMFAIIILPILGFAGAAIDYTRVSSARAEMQNALDSTALVESVGGYPLMSSSSTRGASSKRRSK